MLGINTFKKLHETAKGKPRPVGTPDTKAPFETRREKYAWPVDSSADPALIDGFYVGSDGYAYEPRHFKPSEIPAFVPEHGTSHPRRIFFVNGIREFPTDKIWNPRTSWRADGAAQDLADKSGHPVVFVYNATRGGLTDCLETVMDRNCKGHNPSVQTLQSAMRQEDAVYGEPILAGHSQGAAIISAALSNYQKEQSIDGLDVWLFGGAAKKLPDGPDYKISQNCLDPVGLSLGSRGAWRSDAKKMYFVDRSSGKKEFIRGGPHSTNSYFRGTNFAKMDGV